MAEQRCRLCGVCDGCLPDYCETCGYCECRCVCPAPSEDVPQVHSSNCPAQKAWDGGMAMTVRGWREMCTCKTPCWCCGEKEKIRLDIDGKYHQKACLWQREGYRAALAPIPAGRRT